MRDFFLPPEPIEVRARVIDPDAWCSSDSEAGAFELSTRREDARVLAAVEKNGGGRYRNIIDRLRPGFGPAGGEATVRAKLYTLERAGKIKRDPRYSAVNSIYWVPVPMTADKTAST